MRATRIIATFLIGLCAITPLAYASSSLTYTYDARGRLKTVTVSGGAHSGAVTQYTYDKANNRVRKQTTGA